MTLDTDSFWGHSPAHPPLTDQALATAERLFGHRLPEALVSLLRVQNGGYTAGFVCPTPHRTSWADDHVPVDELFGIGSPDAEPGHQNMHDTGYMTEEWGLPPSQILLSGEGHWWITLDYRQGAEPAVTWLDVEMGEDIQLAPSFEEFLASLRAQSDVDEETGSLQGG